MPRSKRRGPVAEQVAAETTSPADDTSFNVADFEPASGEILHAVADTSRTEPEPPAAPAEPTAPLAEPAPARSHAESVGRREPVVVNSGLVSLKNDLLAGVKYAEGFRVVGGRKLRDCVITFAEKPSTEVITEMKDAGFDWQPAAKVWTHPIRPDTAMQDRIHGERVFEQVSGMIREQRGIEHSAGVAVG